MEDGMNRRSPTSIDIISHTGGRSHLKRKAVGGRA
jgi:hypothetical protein